MLEALAESSTKSSYIDVKWLPIVWDFVARVQFLEVCICFNLFSFIWLFKGFQPALHFYYNLIKLTVWQISKRRSYSNWSLWIEIVTKVKLRSAKHDWFPYPVLHVIMESKTSAGRNHARLVCLKSRLSSWALSFQSGA